MIHTNSIEVVFDEHARSNEVKVPALTTEEWAKDDIIWYDSGNNVCKKAADGAVAELNAFIGIASSEKLQGETKGGVSLKCRIIGKVSSATGSNLIGKAVSYTIAAGVVTFTATAVGGVGHLMEEVVQNARGQIEIDSKPTAQLWETITVAT